MKASAWWRGGTVVVVLALSGCQHMIRANYETEPYGATIDADGAYLGRGSGAWNLAISAEDWRHGERCVVIPPVTAQWLSGAKAGLPAETICVPESAARKDVYVSRLLRRPEGVEGLMLDVDYGNGLVQQELAERTVAAQEAAARAEQDKADAIREKAEAIREKTEALKEQKDKKNG